MLISIDHGNFAIKTPDLEFPAGLAEYTVKPPLATEVIEYNNIFWSLTGSRIPYRRDKTHDDQYFVLTLFAIAKELTRQNKGAGQYTIDLAVGLPPEHFGLHREHFCKYFKRGVHFTYNDIPFDLTIRNVLPFVQAHAAIVPMVSKIKEAQRLYVIDIGGITVDYLLLRNGEPDAHNVRSLELGVITMINSIIGRVSSRYDMLLDDDQIIDVLRGKNGILSSGVVSTIHEAAREHTDTILNTLREHKIDLRTTPSIFIGGGSLLLKKYIEHSPLVASANFLEDTHANAVGYGILATYKLGLLEKEYSVNEDF